MLFNIFENPWPTTGLCDRDFTNQRTCCRIWFNGTQSTLRSPKMYSFTVMWLTLQKLLSFKSLELYLISKNGRYQNILIPFFTVKECPARVLIDENSSCRKDWNFRKSSQVLDIVNVSRDVHLQSYPTFYRYYRLFVVLGAIDPPGSF